MKRTKLSINGVEYVRKDSANKPYDSRKDQLERMLVGEKRLFLAEGITSTRLMRTLWVDMSRIGAGKWTQKEIIGIHAKSKEVYAIVIVERTE